MKRTLYALAALAFTAATVLSGCKKDEEADIRAAPKFGAIRFKNASADQYEVFIDNNSMGKLYGGDSATYSTITPNAHNVSARQVANIVGSPIYRTAQIFVQADSVFTFTFP